MSDEPRAEQADGGQSGDAPVGARDLLRQALVDDQDPRFPWWLPLPGFAIALTWAAYEAVAAGGDFLPTLLWPGAAILVLVTIATWFGWQLEID